MLVNCGVLLSLVIDFVELRFVNVSECLGPQEGKKSLGPNLKCTNMNLDPNQIQVRGSVTILESKLNAKDIEKGLGLRPESLKEGDTF